MKTCETLLSGVAKVRQAGLSKSQFDPHGGCLPTAENGAIRCGRGSLCRDLPISARDSFAYGWITCWERCG